MFSLIVDFSIVAARNEAVKPITAGKSRIIKTKSSAVSEMYNEIS